MIFLLRVKFGMTPVVGNAESSVLQQVGETSCTTKAGVQTVAQI